MGMNVFGTDQTSDDLHDIFYYYADQASKRIANKIVNEIITSAERLKAQPLSGQREELLVSRKLEYRYIVTGN